jgi:hypothetical protein
VFVIVFAGAVAAKVYQHWTAPAAPVAQTRPRPAKAVETPAAVSAPAPTPEPVKPPEPPKPEPKPVAAKPGPEGQRPPKPSMLAEAPKHRQTPTLADVGSKPAPTPVSSPSASVPSTGGLVKALRTEFKLHAPHAQAVDLVGAFIVRGGRKDMSRSADGTWTVTLHLKPGTYRYFFSVDKKRQLDPENPRSDRGASLLSIP